MAITNPRSPVVFELYASQYSENASLATVKSDTLVYSVPLISVSLESVAQISNGFDNLCIPLEQILHQ